MFSLFCFISINYISYYLNCIYVLVPDVLTSCAEFIEKFGIVDGIYRLSGVTSNIQRLR